MFQTTYQLLTFFDSSESVNGRKKLQKIIHLLKSSGTSFPFKYQYHHYGPYSSQLQSEINQLVQQKFIEETYQESMYVYTITEKGREFKKILDNEGTFSFDINMGVFEKLSSESSQFLEMISTYAFLIESGDTSEQAKKKAKELKPHLADKLDKAITYYEEYIVH